MGGLQRIILINCHLPGFIELNLSSHSNICGTNASGKTTLQRLLPVFFGELPSRVVPKTRKKFDEFYLPYTNSYLIYEYQRESEQICQVVLTRKASEGVQYRFINAPYQPEQILVMTEDKNQQHAKAMNKEQWLKQLRHLSIEYSPSWITSTSEFRSVIQNDVSSLGGRANNKESLRLRQLASQYSLVASKHRIRHIEKLVSAVHSKEGKMDTLRSMLAAIFEEDGLVQPTTTVRNTKAKEWIAQMRQTLRLQSLQADYEGIEQLVQTLSGIESQLSQLKPAIVQDKTKTLELRADAQANRQDAIKQFNIVKETFNERESQLNRELSMTVEALNAKQARLEALEAQYKGYLDSDITHLEQDTEALPSLRQELEERKQHYHLLIEQHEDLASQLEQQKLTLAESLNNMVEKVSQEIRTFEQEKDSLRQVHGNKEDSIRAEFDSQKEATKTEFDEQLSALDEQLITARVQLENTQYSSEELEQKQLADLRVDKAQTQWQDAQTKLNEQERCYRQTQVSVNEADKALNDARKAVGEWREKLGNLGNQLSPQKETLRAFLRESVPNWQHSVGKVINGELLERKDLFPRLSDQNAANAFHPMGAIELQLDAIALPDFAQDEESLQILLAETKEALVNAEEQKSLAEKSLDNEVKAQNQAKETVSKQTQWVNEAQNELDYAKQSKQRLNERHALSLAERKNKAKDDAYRLLSQKKDLSQNKQAMLSRLQDEHRQQLQEYKLGWQDELAHVDDKIEQMHQRVNKKRQSNKEQIAELEAAFNNKLADNNIDTQKLSALKQQNTALAEKIQHIVGRSDELREYKTFMATDWRKVRPQLLEEEGQLKRLKQQVETKRDLLLREYKTTSHQHNENIKALEKQISEAGNLLAELTPLVERLEKINVSHIKPQNMRELGDQTERIMRTNENLEASLRTQKKLSELVTQFESALCKDAGKDFLDIIEQSVSHLSDGVDCREKLPILERLLSILEARQKQIVEQGETIGGDLSKFFTVFSDINRRIANQSKRLTDEVQDDLSLDGIAKSQVRIISTVDELQFWEPLKRFAKAFEHWQTTATFLPTTDYLEALSAVVDVLPNHSSFNIESLLRLELHLNEGGSDLVIRNDRQLLESSSHGMAYLILCKFLLAFTRLLRNKAQVVVHWPIDEIGTLAYHNVEKLFKACEKNHIHIVGAFPNPESDVLMLFKHRYLIDKQSQSIEKIEPKLSRITQRLQEAQSLEKQA